MLSNLFGTGIKEAGEGIKSAAQGVGELGLDIRSAITGEMKPETQARLIELADKAQTRSDELQVELNEVDAQHPSLFVAGWRPATAWTCVVALILHFFVIPLGTWVLSMFAIKAVMPVMNLYELVGILIGMLGLSRHRTEEKEKGINNIH